jgi:hypothetical protein
MVLAMTLAGCNGTPQQATPTPTASHNPTGLFDQLAPCEKQPPAAKKAKAVPGMYLPPKAKPAAKSHNGPLTTVTGFVGLNPLEVRKHYELRKDVELLSIEDEGFETEVLVSDGKYRMFFKASVLCRTGSNFAAVIAREEAAGAVPTPAGTPQPQPTQPAP